jgi:hypothetical protein
MRQARTDIQRPARVRLGLRTVFAPSPKRFLFAAIVGLAAGILAFPLSGGARPNRLADEVAPPGMDAAHAGDYSANPNGQTTLVTPTDSDLSDPVLAPPTDTWPDHQLLSNAQYPSNVAVVGDTWWMGTIDGWHVMVWAGVDSSNQTQGEIIVRKLSLDEETSQPDQFYTTPRTDGPLQLTSAQGNQLSASATDGATFTFDPSTSLLTQTGGCTALSCP